MYTFQFTRPRGARRRRAGRVAHRERFNSRAHGGRDPTKPKPKRKEQTFQFTRPRGARLRKDKVMRFLVVSIHAPTGGATKAASDGYTCNCFNSRAHGGRDLAGPLCGGRAGVSIHAPTGGATVASKSIFTITKFQFTRPRGARPSTSRARTRRASFNSRAHGGRDASELGLTDEKVEVSIHAPTGGATLCVLANQKKGKRFNSRAHGGRDLVSANGKQAKKFQFTRPRGARPRMTRSPSRDSCFNSRAHGGRDGGRECRVHQDQVSIHAPTGGATVGPGSARDICVFQFTRPRGARQGKSGSAASAPSFNSRAHGGRDGCPRADRPPSFCFNSRAHGGRDSGSSKTRFMMVFQFTRPRGARPKAPEQAVPDAGFNSRAHGGRDVDVPRVADGVCVSIHAPTGGATGLRRITGPPACFNSRAHGGRDFRGREVHPDHRGFNSRAHGGRDR